MTSDPPSHAADLLGFVAAGPSPVHAVAEMVQRLEAAGFTALDERGPWSLDAGARRYVVRDGGSLVAFRVGDQPPTAAGYRIVGAHTDSPTFKVRPVVDVERVGLRLVGVERYGSPLVHTWMDRDLGVAGRLAIRDGDDVRLVPVRVDEPLLRIPSLAVHLDREVNERLVLDLQRHVVPLAGPSDGPSLLEVVAASGGVDPAAVVGHDLVLADAQPPAVAGVPGAQGGQPWVTGPRLDNLLSCYAAVQALVAAGRDGADPSAVLVANDHEEVGSASSEGAAGDLLDSVLRRISTAADADADAHARAVAGSLLVSCDTAHAVHPNYVDRHEPEHRPRLGGGPVLKVNADQRYATDAGTGGWFAARCADAGVPLQRFVTRGDLPCGSTIGPLTATRTGIATVDVGAPILSMHSIREQAAAADIQPMVAALRTHLLASGQVRR